MSATRDTSSPAQSARDAVWRMFDRIAPRYDLLNRLLSGGRDVAWRKRLARHLPPGEDLRVLDLATGTGDVLIMLDQASGRICSGLGVDMAGEMLALGQRKLERGGLTGRFTLARADATVIPAADDSVDAVTIAFGIRNVDCVEKALAEMRRVLKPGGRALILEFSLPSTRLFRGGYLFYFRHVLPRIGGLISGDRQAYRYLNETVESFPYGEAFIQLMERQGFHSVKQHPLTFGIASIYEGEK